MAEKNHSSSAIMWKAILAAVVLMIVIVPFSMRDRSTVIATTADEETAARIQPVARVELQRAAAATGPRSGELSKANVDLPEPETPVTTLNLPRGISTDRL